MSFWGDIANDAKNSLRESIDSARATINDNINKNLDWATSNNVLSVQRPKRGFYSGVQAYGVLCRSVLRPLNYYQDTLEGAYAVPVTVSDSSTDDVGEVIKPKRYDLRSGLYANEYNNIISEFAEQTGEGSTISVNHKNEETSGVNGENYSKDYDYTDDNTITDDYTNNLSWA